MTLSMYTTHRRGSVQSEDRFYGARRGRFRNRITAEDLSGG
jgi:uridine phosphorylase